MKWLYSTFQPLFWRNCICGLFFLAVVFSAQAQQDFTNNSTPLLSPASTSSLTPLSKTHFLHVTAINFLKVIPPPPKPRSKRQEQDQELLHDVIATRTKKQMERAKMAIEDNVFDYAATLGPNFNPSKYPHMAKLFAKIKADTNVAIHSAKNAFRRPRPETWAPTNDENKNKKKTGYAYPSGHSTRAFLWAALLEHLFPDKRKEIKEQARQKAWNRVVLGRHYPNDVYAGEVYGNYLAEEFLKDPKFEQEWEAIRQEVTAASNNVVPFEKTRSSPNPKNLLIDDWQ
ncbi:MAG: phosphatase PAP2 family protein [Chthoniobacterales bacterium]|nr:phosphatase PAP2 family protein [Chthoniobacterales bacterium]